MEASALAQCSFETALAGSGLHPLQAETIDILQMNITRRCTMACKHCHVEAGPGRTEVMSRSILVKCLSIAAHHPISTIDITGGAPEMHPDLAWLLEAATKLDKRVIIRTNLAILLEPPYRHFVDLYAQNKIEVVASLPDYRGERTEKQRGSGSFARSITALRMLNAHGFGIDGSGLILSLVHNPAGAFLPARQESLEREYRTHLAAEQGVSFNQLYCLTNCPVGRFLAYLIRSDNYGDYMTELRRAYNPAAAAGVMCRTTLSVGWDGTLYDCDFNQMLGLSVDHGAPNHLDFFDFGPLARRQIVINDHCFSCTAGAGSSCQGATEKNCALRNADCGLEKRPK